MQGDGDINLFSSPSWRIWWCWQGYESLVKKNKRSFQAMLSLSLSNCLKGYVSITLLGSRATYASETFLHFQTVRCRGSDPVNRQIKICQERTQLSVGLAICVLQSLAEMMRECSLNGVLSDSFRSSWMDGWLPCFLMKLYQIWPLNDAAKAPAIDYAELFSY